jgi:hypothetical protein
MEGSMVTMSETMMMTVMMIIATSKHAVCGWQRTLLAQSTSLELLRTYSRGRNEEQRENSENRAGTRIGATLG